MLDLHSHIIPNIDDGASSVEEAIALLKSMKAQGCTHAIATPHFYPQYTDIVSFKENLNQTFSKFQNDITDVNDIPKVILGCEIYYFPELALCDDLPLLTLGNSKYLLMEFPRSKCITTRTIESIINLTLNRGLTPIIAHIENYVQYKNFDKLLELKHDGYVRTQINANSFKTHQGARICVNLLKQDAIDYIASDAHSVKKRPVCFDDAFSFLDKKLSSSVKTQFVTNSIELLKEIGFDSFEKK